MTGKNPNLYLVNINAYIKFGEILSISAETKLNGHNSTNNITTKPKMTGNNPNVDLVIMNACIYTGA